MTSTLLSGLDNANLHQVSKGMIYRAYHFYIKDFGKAWKR